MKKSKKSSKLGSKDKKFVFIYGAMAVGKLTVARELEKITDHHVLHNHDIIDLVQRFWDRGSLERSIARCDLAFYIAESFLKLGAKMIFTHAYSDKFVFKSGLSDKDYVKKLWKIAEKCGYEFCPIQLTCDEKVVLKRLKKPSRAEFNKLRDIETMKKAFETEDFVTPIKHKNNITIDNTNIPAKKVAQMIKKHFNL